ncbi:hypothetical protein [Candidatus Hodarchaeum mangrovi]
MSLESFKKSDFQEFQPSRLTTIGVILALLWLLITFLQEKPELFILLGSLNFLIMVFLRIRAQRKSQIGLEGGTQGYLMVWLITSWIYNQKSALVISEVQVQDIMILLLALTFLVWFIISPQESSQELIFNLPPYLSKIILNLWKLAVLVFFFFNLRELRSFKEIGILFFLGVGFFDLFLFYLRQVKINYVDIILNPIKLLNSLFFSSFLISSKWILLTFIFILLDQMELDLLTGSLIVGSLFVSIISIITSTGKLTLSSGLVESRIKEGKAIIPEVIEEAREITTPEHLRNFNEFYLVTHNLKLVQEQELSNFHKNDLILRFPFSRNLQNKVGVYIFHLNRHELLKQIVKEQREKGRGSRLFFKINQGSLEEDMKTSIKNLNIKGSSVKRLSLDKWTHFKENLKPITREEFAVLVGFKKREELEERLGKLISGTIMVQEQVRSRIRGVPAPSFKGEDSYEGIMTKNQLIIPALLTENWNLKENQEVEIIKGKQEYLFYVKLKKPFNDHER